MSQLQVSLFNYIRSKVPANISLVDEIADVLEISNDSAYRRIRGEKQISFEEIQKLSHRFKISIDQVLSLKNNTMMFSGNFIEPGSFDFLQYLDDMYKTIAYITSFRSKELICFSKDIPFFYYYMFPELAAFKFFVWMKTLLQFPDYKTSKFGLSSITDEFYERANRIALAVCKIPFTEIMNVENIQITLRQIEYYKDTGLFASPEVLDTLYRRLYDMVDHMECQAAAGKKFMPGRQPTEADTEMKLFVNDFVLGDNSIVCILDDRKMGIILHNVVNIMISQDEKFCDYSHRFIQNVISKSNLISLVSERERSIFFNMIRQRIDSYRNNEIKTLGKAAPYF